MENHEPTPEAQDEKANGPAQRETGSPDRPTEAPKDKEAPPGILPYVVAIIAVSIVLAVAIKPAPIDFSHGGTRGRVDRARADMVSMAAALESYYADNSTYPAWATGSEGINAFAEKGSPAYGIPTFRIWTAPPGPGAMHTLTTPIAYLSGFPTDPLAYDRGAVYGYYTDPKSVGWILFSAGPDDAYDVDPAHDYDPFIAQPSNTLLFKSYDPSNGTYSRGDIIRVKS